MATIPQATKRMLVKVPADIAPASLLIGSAHAIGLTAGAAALKAIGNPVPTRNSI